MNKLIVFLILSLLVLTIAFAGYGCKKAAEKEETITETGQDISGLISDIDALDLNIDLGNESLSDEESLI